MKILALMGLMCTALWAGDNYQTCGLVVASGEVICGEAKNRQGAEFDSLAMCKYLGTLIWQEVRLRV